MINTLNIIVELPGFKPCAPFRKVYERQVDVDASISLPYTSILGTFKFLNCTDAFITFIID